jgi:hypothetical protein
VRVGSIELSEVALDDDDDDDRSSIERNSTSTYRLLHRMQTSHNRDVVIAQVFVRSRVSSSSQESRDILEIDLNMSVRDTVFRHRVKS